ncbi:DUF308 domain-containing protein, partial [Aquipuribacter hungaricus]
MSSEDLARARRTGTSTWVWLAVGGVVSLVLGLVSVAAPGSTVGVLAVVLSLWLVAAGLGRVALASATRTWTSGRRTLQGALGVVMAAAGLAGLLGLFDPLTVVTVVVAAGFLVAGAADLGLAATGPRGLGRAASTGLGLLHLLIGLTFLLLPQVGLAVLTVLVGLALLVLGLVQLAAAGVVRALVRQADALAARLGGPHAPGSPLAPGRRLPGDEDPRVVRGEV